MKYKAERDIPKFAKKYKTVVPSKLAARALTSAPEGMELLKMLNAKKQEDKLLTP